LAVAFQDKQKLTVGSILNVNSTSQKIIFYRLGMAEHHRALWRTVNMVRNHSRSKLCSQSHQRISIPQWYLCKWKFSAPMDWITQ